MSDDLLYETNGHVVTLTINRPDRRNPLGLPGDGDLFADAAERINQDADVSCAILTGAGSAFSSGGDLKAMRERSGEFAGSASEIAARYENGIHRLVQSLWQIEVPLIAAVNGPAIGLGNDVACLADIRIAADTASFGATFLKVGLVPGDGGAWLLPRVIGLSRAAELLYTGRILDAATALDWGLISRIAPADELMQQANELAADISKLPPGALRMTKQLIRAGIESDYATVMSMSARLQGQAHMTDDHREALDAFFEKRPPKFTGN